MGYRNYWMKRLAAAALYSTTVWRRCRL